MSEPAQAVGRYRQAKQGKGIRTLACSCSCMAVALLAVGARVMLLATTGSCHAPNRCDQYVPTLGCASTSIAAVCRCCYDARTQRGAAADFASRGVRTCESDCWPPRGSHQAEDLLTEVGEKSGSWPAKAAKGVGWVVRPKAVVWEVVRYGRESTAASSATPDIVTHLIGSSICADPRALAST